MFLQINIIKIQTSMLLLHYTFYLYNVTKLILYYKEYIYKFSRLEQNHQWNEAWIKIHNIIVPDFLLVILEIFLLSFLSLAEKIVTLNINAGQSSKQGNEHNE